LDGILFDYYGGILFNYYLQSKEYIDSELERLLECEVIMIPAYAKKYDMTGHADGMVRFVDRNTIIGNKLENEFANWRKEMQEVIAKYNLKYIDVPLLTDMKDRKHPLSAQGVYVNFLEVNNLIVLPVFGRPEDDEVIKIMTDTFPDRVIEPIDYNDVALEGGLVNCTTWVAKL
jgi:agmatine/peptidylarginine deiminase